MSLHGAAHDAGLRHLLIKDRGCCRVCYTWRPVCEAPHGGWRADEEAGRDFAWLDSASVGVGGQDGRHAWWHWQDAVLADGTDVAAPVQVPAWPTVRRAGGGSGAVHDRARRGRLIARVPR